MTLMVNFVLSKNPTPQWVGGPPAMCHICQFHNESEKQGYLICEGVKVLMHDAIEVDLHLCLTQHAAELKRVLDEIMPDPRMPKLQGKLLNEAAARARAEKRAERAEKALHAMQDWITGETDEDPRSAK